MSRGILFALALVAAMWGAPAPAVASTDDGQKAYARKDYAAALAAFKPLAEAGDPKAQVWLGRLYSRGHGLPKDPVEAARWWSKAASAGDAEGANALGVAYFVGAGVARNPAEAIEWWKKAAAKGSVGAHDSLGVAYRAGVGVPQDYAEAVKHFRVAAEKGLPSAMNNLGSAYRIGQGVVKDEFEAVKWYRKSADKGYPAALSNLGTCYVTGLGVPKDPKEGIRLYLQAADKGHAAAFHNLGSAYRQGLGVEANPVLAYMWLNLAAARGNAPAATMRAQVQRGLTPEEVAAGQALASAWKPGQSLAQLEAKAKESAPRSGPLRRTGIGTGFVVAPGLMLTNHHVVRGCVQIVASFPSGKASDATVKAKDEHNDLALLALELPQLAPATAAFRGDRGLRLGDAVVTFGYPLATALSSGGNLTTGNVTALAGLKDDVRMMQISAPIQPGNSGGPVLDSSAHVVGVVVSKINALRIAQATGDIPQNVNFAIKDSVARAFLQAHGVDYKLEPSGAALAVADVGEKAKSFTAKIECKK